MAYVIALIAIVVCIALWTESKRLKKVLATYDDEGKDKEGFVRITASEYARILTRVSNDYQMGETMQISAPTTRNNVTKDSSYGSYTTNKRGFTKMIRITWPNTEFYFVSPTWIKYLDDK